MRYLVRAAQRAGHAGFRRGGIFFPSNQDTPIDSKEIGKEALAAILSEPMLSVRKESDVEAEEPREDDLTRKELDSIAERLGVKDAKKLGSKSAVVEAIRAQGTGNREQGTGSESEGREKAGD